MKLSSALVTAVLAAGATASWLSSAAYNKWHETELERWLADHNIPHPTPATRKDLEDLVRENWDSNAVAPYQNWDLSQLRGYLQSVGRDVESATEATKNNLISQVKATWYETDDKSQHAWGDVKGWMFDTWSDSELKAFCDKRGIAVPQPRNRDVMLKHIRSNYESAARKAGETAAYPGDWLYETWTDSDLKAWLDKYGFKVPRTALGTTKRDQLISAVRRNSRLAYLKEQETEKSASEAAQSVYKGVTNSIIDTWSESVLKEFCDKNGITVPQGTRLNELRALVRKHRASVLGEDVPGTLGAATTKAGNEFAKATDSAALMYEDAFNKATAKWSQSKLKSFLDARGVPVPQNSEVDDLRALVRKHAHVAAGGWTFDDWSIANLKNFLKRNGDIAAKTIAEKATATRDELVGAAKSAYASIVAVGGEGYDAASKHITQTTEEVKKDAFQTWTDSELKAYLESCGVPVRHDSTVDALRAEARKQYSYWNYGTKSPAQTAYAKASEGLWGTLEWFYSQVGYLAEAAQQAARNLRNEL
ncbi:related to brefeldin A resistance protein [Cephalotrichum gorgonifer]|uniref:Related to brefeldin A resistance protein n=1 Tax=Cephalotrichum gorgonifer TaxID=2041049 RepID=A0AAE8SWZ2_9PEZI|nr:related to brefeldin A resistance protein [Cephalotrichum gorgonifer]